MAKTCYDEAYSCEPDDDDDDNIDYNDVYLAGEPKWGKPENILVFSTPFGRFGRGIPMLPIEGTHELLCASAVSVLAVDSWFVHDSCQLRPSLPSCWRPLCVAAREYWSKIMCSNNIYSGGSFHISMAFRLLPLVSPLAHRCWQLGWRGTNENGRPRCPAWRPPVKNMSIRRDNLMWCLGLVQ